MIKKTLYTTDSYLREEFKIEGFRFGSTGEDSEPSACIVGSMRGNEFQQLFICSLLVKRLKELEASGSIVGNHEILVIPSLNNSSMNVGMRYWVSDNSDINREFPGNPQGTRMDRLAYEVVQKLHSAADYYIDLHSGDDYEKLTPYVYYAGKAAPEVMKISRQMAEQVDVPYMVKSEVSSGGSYNYAASCGIPSVLLERGGMGAWETEEVRSMKRDVRSILRFLGIYDGHRSMRKYYPLNVTDVQYQSASYTGLWYPQKRAGDLFTEGEILGYVKDYEDNILETCTSYGDGVILYQTGSLQVIKDGPMVAYGRISYEEDDRKEKIAAYWTKRSDSFLEQRRAELHSPLAKRWLEEIEKYLPKKALSPEKKIEDESKERKDAVAKIKEKETGNGKLKILDVGCGTGFFTILLAKQGHQVTGTDLTPDMITNSRILAKEEQVTCDFQVMDAEHLTFQDESFDVVISRNLTWTLPEAAQAYKEWSRVLKPGGLLLNFDANYGATNFAETSDLPENHAHNQLGNSLMQECEDIKRQLPISSYLRPAWDVEELGKNDMEQISIDLGLSKRVYKERDEFYNPTPMFAIAARKQSNS